MVGLEIQLTLQGSSNGDGDNDDTKTDDNYYKSNEN